MNHHLLARYRHFQNERARRANELLPPEHILTQQAIDHAIAEAPDRTPTTVARATLPGDTRRLRGIPVIGHGIGGTQPGSDPLTETIRRLR